jgi:hypothetical protein
MCLRRVAEQEEAVRLLGEAQASGLGRAAWARHHGVDPRALNVWRLNTWRAGPRRPSRSNSSSWSPRPLPGSQPPPVSACASARSSSRWTLTSTPRPRGAC